MKNKEYLNAELVKSILANTPQITFEVTDSCNLSYVYCGYGKLYSNHDERTNKKCSILLNRWTGLVIKNTNFY